MRFVPHDMDTGGFFVAVLRTQPSVQKLSGSQMEKFTTPPKKATSSLYFSHSSSKKEHLVSWVLLQPIDDHAWGVIK